MSGIMRAARTRHCLLAVDAYHGGRWLSPIQPGGVQPTLRNFATEQGRFYDVGVGVSDDEMLNDDFVFECDFENTFPVGEGSIFYSYASQNLFGVYLYSTGKVGVFASIIVPAGSAWTMWNLPDGNYRTTRNTIKVSVIGDTATLELNGVWVETLSGRPRRVSTPNTPSGVEASCGYLHNVKITNLTKNKVVWNYPSWPEKVRLLTYNNVTTANGAFEAASSTALGGVITPLDLRGNTTSKTFICKAHCPRHTDDGNLYSHTFISQGYVWGAISYYCCGFFLREDYRAGARSLSLYCIYAGATAAQGVMAAAVSENVLGRDCVFAGVIDMERKRVSVYIDGALVTSVSITGEPWRTTIDQASYLIPVDRVAIRQDQHANFLAHDKIYSALIYDTALTASQIAAISKTI